MNLPDLTIPVAPDVSFPANERSYPTVSRPVKASVGPRAVSQLPTAAVMPQLRGQHHASTDTTVRTTSASWSGAAPLPAHIKLSNDISRQVKRQLSDDEKCIVYYANKSVGDGIKSVRFTEYAQGFMGQQGLCEEALSGAVKLCSVMDASDTGRQGDDYEQSHRQFHFVENPEVNKWMVNHMQANDELDIYDDDQLLQYSDGNRWYPLKFFGGMAPHTLVDARYVLISNRNISRDEPPDFSVNVQKYISDTIAKHHCDTLGRVSEILECSSSDDGEKLASLRDFLQSYRSRDSEVE
ncbi:hypothetical protein [Endozoicomonas sp. ONNA2]|uniref:hypothetical protein n=1 Tax=Endozoicomonas sp. ONNA2 TaxID=2828741 RepID=UPI00214812C8|nr:hypothetical protein [Endozoicomonas sp. ONNA2]